MLLHIRDTYNCDYLPHMIFLFYSINFQLTWLKVSHENTLKKRKIKSNNSVTLNENNFRVFVFVLFLFLFLFLKIGKLEFKASQCPMGKYPVVTPLVYVNRRHICFSLKCDHWTKWPTCDFLFFITTLHFLRLT